MAIGTTNATTIIGGTSSGNLSVRYWDIDGTLLKEQFVNSGENATPPTNPTRTDLTFDEWNIDSTNITSHLDIGATYTTTNGRTIIYLEINNYNIGTVPTLQFNKQNNSTCTIYWGDGTTSTTTSTGSVSIAKAAVYPTNGTYKVEIENTSGFLNNDNKAWFLGLVHNQYIRKIYSGNHSTLLLEGTIANSNYNNLDEVSINRNTTTTTLPNVTNNSLKGLVIPRGFTRILSISSSRNITFLSIPKTVDTITSSLNGMQSIERIIISNPACSLTTSFSVQQDSNIKLLVLPTGLNTLTANMFTNCYRLIEIVNFPTNITSIGISSLNGCTYRIDTLNLSLCTAIPNSAVQTYRSGVNIILPTSWTNTTIGTSALATTNFTNITVTEGATVLGTQALASLIRIQKIDLPSTMVTLNNQCMENAFTLNTLIVRATTPPTAGTSFLNNSPVYLKIYVPDASVAAYQAADGWSTYTARIYPLSSL